MPYVAYFPAIYRDVGTTVDESNNEHNNMVASYLKPGDTLGVTISPDVIFVKTKQQPITDWKCNSVVLKDSL